MEKFIWNKKGQIFDPYLFDGWGRHYSQIPYYININGVEKIFFTSRVPGEEPGTYLSSIHSIDAVVNDSCIELKNLKKEPLIKIGDIATFDDAGNMPCSVIYHPDKDEVWLYFLGWSRKVRVPYDMAIGLAISKDGGNTFTKISKGPIIGANIYDPFMLSCSRVFRFNNKWIMYYHAGANWFNVDGKMEPQYKLKMGTSDDGINWQRDGKFVIPEVYENESQTSATVFELDGLYHMLFTYRHSIDFRNPERGYRIGYAYSTNLIEWTRNDETGNFHTSESGWDSEMVCYPSIHKIGGRYIMFYCGNYFGKYGFGYAELVNKNGK